ncbi:MAG: glycerol kinase GlpK [Pseudomonadota bacterium]|jgi:glycerol kinase
MSSQFILALDQGTTSSRAILFDRDGCVRGSAQQELRQIFPHPGWVEHNAEEIWTSQLALAQQVLREQRLTATDIAAIGMTNQRETTVLWDRSTGIALANAIVWQDRRTAKLCDALQAEGYGPLFQQKTGLIIDSYFSGTKLRWLLDNVPGARERAERGELAFGTVDSWLVYQLAGVHLTDTSNASRTMMFNIHTLDWDDELLAILKIPRAILPQVVPSSGIAAYTDAQFFGAPIAIAGIAGDQQAATYGQACFHSGMVKSTYGTGCFILMNTDKAVTSQNNLLTTVGWTSGHALPHKTDYMLEGGVFMGGATIQWLRDGLGIIKDSSEVEALASRVADSDGVTFVPAFSGLGAPHWDAYARGTMLGITRGTNAGHIARAALEGIAFQTADVVTAMQKDATIPLKELRVDGGAARNNMLMQFQADILGVPVVRPEVTETTALGAAYLAGLGVGFWSAQDEIAAQWRMARCFEPQMSDVDRTDKLGVWARAIERARLWA